MNPSVKPFYSRNPSYRPASVLLRSSQPTMPAQAGFMSKPIHPVHPDQPLVSSACPARTATDVMQPSYALERPDMHQQAFNGNAPFFPPQPHMTAPTASNHSIGSLIADMWKSCPALCASIRHDFDLNVIFHPALIALYGETFLRLAASQIAMHNQATEMTNMRNALLQKQKLLSINADSAKSLQTKFVSQQSELNEIKRLLEQQPQSLTSSDATDNGQVQASQNPSQNQKGDVAFQGVTVSPTTTASTLAEIDGPVHKFYNRSATLLPLDLSLDSDSLEEYHEQHGYGHAETQGPSFRLDRANDGKPGKQRQQLSEQSNPLPPTVSTATEFKPEVLSVARPIVSLGIRQQAPIVRDNGDNGGTEDDKEKAGRMSDKDRTSAGRDWPPAAGIHMVREHGDKSGLQGINKTPETSKKETEKDIFATGPTTPPRVTADDKFREGPTIIPNKPASYAAAVRTAPIIKPNSEQTPNKSCSATPENAPTPDLGFTLEPLPKPTIQQVLSQQQQPQPTKPESNSEEAPYDFNEWKQRKIEAGTWEDRTNPTTLPRGQYRPNFPTTTHYPNARYPNPHHANKSHYPNPHHPTNRPFQPSYRGRGGSGGGRFNNNNHYHQHDHQNHPNHSQNDNFSPDARMSNEEERKRSWLAWKHQCILEGRWHPTHPFREEWKNQ
jgi:hypothetical protein